MFLDRPTGCGERNDTTKRVHPSNPVIILVDIKIIIDITIAFLLIEGRILEAILKAGRE